MDNLSLYSSSHKPILGLKPNPQKDANITTKPSFCLFKNPKRNSFYKSRSVVSAVGQHQGSNPSSVSKFNESADIAECVKLYGKYIIGMLCTGNVWICVLNDSVNYKTSRRILYYGDMMFLFVRELSDVHIESDNVILNFYLYWLHDNVQSFEFIMGSPLFWVGVGVAFSAAFSWTASYLKHWKKAAMQQAFKTMMGQMDTQNNQFGNAGFSPGSPFPFPTPATPGSSPFPFPPPSQPTSSSATSSSGPASGPFVDVSPEETLKTSFDKVEESAETESPKESEYTNQAFQNGAAFKPPMDGPFQGASSSGKGTTGPVMSVEALEKMMEDPTVQKMVYPDASKPTIPSTTAGYAFHLFFYRNSMGGSPEWDNRMMDSLKNFDISSPEVKEQFDQIGLTPEEVISKIMANPDVAMAFQNPRVQAAIMDCSQNPMSIMKYQNDKEVMDVFNKISELFPGVTDQIGLTPEEVISKIMANPDVAMAFQNPRVQAAIMDCSQNPMSIMKYQNDKEVMDVFNKISELFPGVTGSDLTSFLVCWRFDAHGNSEFKRVYLGPSLKEIDSSDSHVCGIVDVTNELVCWQWNGFNYVGSRFSSNVAVGEKYVCGLSETGQIKCLINGTVICWGENEFGLPKNLENESFEWLQVGRGVFCGVLTANYSLYCWGNESLDSNSIVFGDVVPGLCTSRCACSPTPNYDTFCGGGLMICNPCTNQAPPQSVPPLVAPPQNNDGWSRKMIAFVVVGSVGSLSFIIVLLFLFFRCCKSSEGSRVHDSGPMEDIQIASQIRASNNRVLVKKLSHLISMGTGNPLEEFSLQTILDATDNFSDHQRIGVGSFGSVYRGLLTNGRKVAVKRAELSSSSSGPSGLKKRQEDTNNAFQSSLPRNHRFRAKMVGMLHLVKETMLLDTLRRDVVGVEVDNSNDGATGASRISHSNEENVVDLQLALWNDVDKKHVSSEMFDKKCTKRDQKIDLGENLMIYCKNVVGDEVKNIGDWLSRPTYVEGEASKGWFLQMTDSLDKIDKVFNHLMHIEFVPM
ncbi:Concanavalin A-like lectin/glucanase, subgroup [Artemisia annua]|uniref:Protein TIC 40, chloroplastic n=1 Tax=Artemisia annua TaxID=35608 RepID=A0A2U1MDD7_ARTAN|nr:Concanavalin A-like lectin/glucanase, subgroup [Artemisia annua]